jgi:hypothetical protein
MGAAQLKQQENQPKVKKKTKLTVFENALKPKKILGNTGISILDFLSERINDDLNGGTDIEILAGDIGVCSGTIKRLRDNIPNENGNDYNPFNGTIDRVLLHYNYELSLSEVEVSNKMKEKALRHYHYSTI